jgi:hypothetical protein
MDIDPSQLVVQFCLQAAVLLAFAAVAMKIIRVRSKPRGTYGNGLPERRKRTRIVLPDPATLQPRPLAPGETI